MEVSLNRREAMSGVMNIPTRLYLNPWQTVSSDEVQYTNPFRNISRLKLFFFWGPSGSIIFIHHPDKCLTSSGPALDSSLQSVTFHLGVVLVLNIIREPTSSPRSTAPWWPFTRHQFDVGWSIWGVNGRPTTKPDHTGNSCVWEQGIQSRNSGIQRLSRQINRSTNCSSL